MSDGVWSIPDLEAILLDDVGGVRDAPAAQSQIASLHGQFLKVRRSSGLIQDGWQLEVGAQVDENGLVVVLNGEQMMQVDALYLLQINAALLPPLTPASAAAGAGSEICTLRDTGNLKEVYLARHPHVASACRAEDSDYVPSAATDHVVLKESHVDIGSMKVAAASWRGSHVDKSCCAFKLASHFISRFQKVCLDPSVPVASLAFTAWLAANSRALVGSDSQLHELMAPNVAIHTDTHGNHFLAALACLSEECSRIVKLQPMLVRTNGHTKVYGDIHGQLADLLALFREHGFPSNRSGGDIELASYIFDGDFVDRGPQQVEVVLLLLSLKVAFPDRVVLLRGNHEFKEMNQHMASEGFHYACMQHTLFGPHGNVALDIIYDVFDWLPFAALVSGSVLVVHGGIGDGNWAEHTHQSDIEWLGSIECRPVKSLFNVQHPDPQCMPGTHRHRNLLNIVWSDPITDARPSEWQPHYQQGRGADILSFSSQTTQEFCTRNRISMILRGHEVAEQGYEMLHGGRLCTVFSARNYCGSRTNDAALVLLQPDLHGHVQIKFKTLQHLQ